MFSTKVNIRVRYADTDQMKVVYYGNYAQYFEVGRVEALRLLGLTYKQLEADGIMLPVLKLECKYLRPALYDDYLNVDTFIKEMPASRIVFHHEIRNETGELLTLGKVELAFIDEKTRRPVRCPRNLSERLAGYF